MHVPAQEFSPAFIVADYEHKATLEQTFCQRRFWRYVTVALWAFVRLRSRRLVLIETNCSQAS